MAGIFYCGEGEMVTLQNQTGYSAKTLSKGIRELIDTHWIAYREGIMWIINHLKYEPGISMNNPKHAKGVENILKSLPKSEIIVKFCDYYNLGYPFDTLSIPFRNNENDNDNENDNEKEKDIVPFAEIIRDLNSQTGKNYKHDAEATQRLIRARWSEGYRFEHFQKVHSNKARQWKDDPKMDEYLRPSTLYGTKFEAYLNQADGPQGVEEKLRLLDE